MMRTKVSILLTAVLTAGTNCLHAGEPALPPTPYIGGPVELVKAPNGAIVNKRILDGIEKVAWLEPSIEQPAEGIWVFGGYGLGPIATIDTDEGLIATDTDDVAEAARVLNLFDRYDPGRAVVVPPASLLQDHM